MKCRETSKKLAPSQKVSINVSLYESGPVFKKVSSAFIQNELRWSYIEDETMS